MSQSCKISVAFNVLKKEEKRENNDGNVSSIKERR